MNIRTVLNFILTGIVYWAAAYFFPEYIWFDGTKWIILTTIVTYIANSVFMFLLFAGGVAGVVIADRIAGAGGVVAVIIAAILIGLSWGILQMIVLTILIPGFHIKGDAFLAYLLLGFAVSAFRVKGSDKNADRNENSMFD